MMAMAAAHQAAGEDTLSNTLSGAKSIASSPRRVERVWVALATSLSLVGACQLDASLKHRCQVTADCSGDRACVRHVCEVSGDPRPNIMFVTSRQYPTRFQPLEVADEKCNDAAEAAGLPGEYRAWLSTAAIYARDRLKGARGWVRPDGAPFADTIDDITAGRIFTPPLIDEWRHEVHSDEVDLVATGTSALGYNDPGMNCNEWANDIAATVTAGVMDATGDFWTSFSAANCGRPMRIYCFGVDQSVAVSPAAGTGKLAFVSEAPFLSTETFVGGDALCAQEARAAALPGSFLALLGTTGFVAAWRFAETRTAGWVRVDGVNIKAAGSDLFEGSLLAPLNVTSTGHYLRNNMVLTGSATPFTFATPDENCQNWTITDGFALGGMSSRADRWWTYNATNCYDPLARIYCLQQ